MPVACVPDLGELTEWETFCVARRRAGVTQTALAQMTGLIQSKISAWERTGQGLRKEQVERAWIALGQLLEAT